MSGKGMLRRGGRSGWSLLSGLLGMLAVVQVCAQPASREEMVLALADVARVDDRVVEAFRDGAEQATVYLTVRAIAQDLPFYRPVIDDPPERRRATLESVLASARSVAGASIQAGSDYLDTGSVQLDVNLAGALALASHPNVEGLDMPVQFTQQLAMSTSQTGILGLQGQGYLGQGVKVAVIDARFAPSPSIVEEQCFCTVHGMPCCPNGTSRQQGPGAANLLVDPGQIPGHANLVRSVIAGAGQSGAPQAGIVAIATDLGTGVHSALNWLTTRPDIRIVVVSLDAGNNFSGLCDASGLAPVPLFKAPISLLHRQGTAVVVAAGNSDRRSLLGYAATGVPACLSTTITVTGTWRCNYDKLCPFSDAVTDRLWWLYPEMGADTSTATDLAAPAAPIIGIGGPPQGLMGTSYSAPIAAACAAQLLQARPGAGVEDVRTALRTSPFSATRPGHGSFPRLSCTHAMNWMQTNAGVRLNQHGLTGNWYRTSTPGQGFTLEIFPDNSAPGTGLLFGGWFTYDTVAGGSERQRWYTLSGTVSSTSSIANLTIARAYGGNFAAPPPVASTAAGSATIRFKNCNEGTLSYSFHDGRSGVMPLARLLPNVRCTVDGMNAPAASDFLLSGNWYQESTSGQGLIIEVNPNQPFLFASWFTYAPNGQQVGGAASQRWYTLQSGYTPGQRQINGIPIGESVSSGRFNQGSPVPVTQQVGTANLHFHSCTSATLAYQFTSGSNAGRSGSIPLRRVGPKPPGCNF